LADRNKNSVTYEKISQELRKSCLYLLAPFLLPEASFQYEFNNLHDQFLRISIVSL